MRFRDAAERCESSVSSIVVSGLSTFRVSVVLLARIRRRMSSVPSSDQQAHESRDLVPARCFESFAEAETQVSREGFVNHANGMVGCVVRPVELRVGEWTLG